MRVAANDDGEGFLQTIKAFFNKFFNSKSDQQQNNNTGTTKTKTTTPSISKPIPPTNTTTPTAIEESSTLNTSAIVIATGVSALVVGAAFYFYHNKYRVLQKNTSMVDTSTAIKPTEPITPMVVEEKRSPVRASNKKHNRFLSMKMSPSGKVMMDLLRDETLLKRNHFSAWREYVVKQQEVAETKELNTVNEVEKSDETDTSMNDDDWDKFIKMSQILSSK